MATMVYRGIYLIYHSLPWYISYISQLEALMSPMQSDIFAVIMHTCKVSVNGLIIPFVQPMFLANNLDHS